MKIVAMTVLFVLCAAAVPLTQVPPRAQMSETSVMAFDVCDIQGHGISACSDILFLCEYLSGPLPLGFCGSHETLCTPLKTLLTVFHHERPPEA